MRRARSPRSATAQRSGRDCSGALADVQIIGLKAMAADHPIGTASTWVRRWCRLLEDACATLDLACGRGRHSVVLAAAGHPVLAVDRDARALAALPEHSRIETLQADLEAPDWPLAGRRFGGIVVTNYLHRPRFAALLDALADDGVLIYETFARGNERYGKPSNPDFLLEPGELLERVRGRLRVIAYEERLLRRPQPAMVQRICACTQSAAQRLSPS